MTLPASGAISLDNFRTEMSDTGDISISWINDRAKVTSNSLSGHYGKAYYQSTMNGNCNNASASNCACACGDQNCANCVNCTPVNCANCDTQKWLQANCNCNCTYNCTSSQVTINCNCVCVCADCGDGG